MRVFRALMIAVGVFSVGWTMFVTAGWRIPGVAWLADYLTAHATMKTPHLTDDMYMGSLLLWVSVPLALWFLLRRPGKAEAVTSAADRGWERVDLPTGRSSRRGRAAGQEIV